jgi:hypothetical protein
MTQNVKDLVVPVAMVGALLAQSFYLGRASQRLDAAVDNVSRVAVAAATTDRELLGVRSQLSILTDRIAAIKEEGDLNKARWEKDHYQLLAHRVVQP